MVKKKRAWRKNIDDSHSKRTEIEERLQQDTQFTLDTTGDLALQRKIIVYPEKFAKDRIPRRPNKPKNTKKGPAVKTPDTTTEFDLWGQEQGGTRVVWPESHIPAVIPAKPGQSYRPSEGDHAQVLSAIVHEEELKLQKAEEYRRMTESYRVLEFDEESPQLSEDDGEAHFRQNPPVKEKHLTNSEKNRKLKNTLMERYRKELGKKKQITKDINGIPGIIKDIEAEEQANEVLRGELNTRNEQKLRLQAKGDAIPKIVMGKTLYAQPETLGSRTVPQHLRSVQLKGNSIEERFDSYVRRRMVDIDLGPKKKKVTVFKTKHTGEGARKMQRKREKQDPEKVEL